MSGVRLSLVLGIAFGLLATACSILDAPDVPATLRAENTAFVAEATGIVRAVRTREAVVAATARAAGTVIAELSSINRQLVVTARAVSPPTPVRQVGVAAEGLSMTLEPGAAPQFVDIGAANSVRRSDGCADSFQTQFPTSVDRIYVNARALAISAGTVVRVEWLYNGQVVSQDSYRVPRDETNYCLWFYIDPASVSFTPGSWTAQFYADDRPVQPLVAFLIVEN